jgi:hypothetical protein
MEAVIMKRQAKLTTWVLVGLMLLTAAAPVCADIIRIPMAPGETKVFTRSTADPEQVVGTNYWDHEEGGFQLVATVNYDPSRGADRLYYYKYNVSAEGGLPLQHTLSHVLIGVTEPSSLSDFKDATPAIADGPKTWYTLPNNQYMPGPLYGVKWNAASAGVFQMEFYTAKNPVWGNFYARCGGGKFEWNAAYNTDFLTEPTISTTDFSGWAPRPNGGADPVPVPASLLLVGTGCIALAMWRWRRPAAS